MWKKIVHKYKPQLLTLTGSKKVERSGCVLDESIRGRKAAVVLNGKPTVGTILKVQAVCQERPSPLRIFVSFLTADNRDVTFEATEKLRNREFKLISTELYYKIAKVKNLATLWNTLKFSPSKYEKTESTADAELADVRPGDLVETKILSGKHKGIWIRAEVRDVGEQTMSIRVLRPEKWNVALFAVQVPKKFIRCVLLEDKDNYTVPISFVVDNKVSYLSCSKEMTANNLREPLSEMRGVEPNQLIFVSRGVLLEEGVPVPDDKIFCIICQKGGLTENQMRLLSNMGTELKQETRHTKYI